MAVLLSGIPARIPLLAWQAQAPPPRDPRAQLPLIVTAVRIEGGGSIRAGYGFPTVDVRNVGKLKILACGIRFDEILPDGKTQPHGFSIDSAHTTPALRRAVIAPGALVTLGEGGGVLVPTQATTSAARVTFVVFEDDTALGDEREIARIFADRREHQRFRHEMDAMFEEATGREGDPRVAFDAIRERMERDPKFAVASGGWYNEILARMTERRMALPHTTPEAVLENVRSTIAEQKTLCDAHVQRRLR